MAEVKKHTIHRNEKCRNIEDLRNQKVVFITKSEVSPVKSLFPKKMKKVNNLLKKADLLP